uniref:Major facilitator superfamily (MFS) profile domain-containing protein n=1 Tax=Plectus sambesii TaxID=2011161 RepID=A0A914VK53_9BILA
MWRAALADHKKLMLLSGTVAFLAMFQMGYSASYPNTSFHAFKAFINNSYVERGRPLTEEEFNWLWALILNTDLIAFLIGSWLCPPMVEKFGRKTGLLGGNLIKLIAGSLMIVSIKCHSTELLAAGRMISGLGDGLAASSLTLFLQETSPTNIRGLVSGFQELSISFATLIGVLFGLPYVFGSSLATLVGLSAVPNAALIFILMFCPDTPKYLYVEKKDKLGAIAAVTFYHGVDRDEAIDVISELDKEHEGEQHCRTTFREVFSSRHLRKAVLLGSAACIFQIVANIPITFYSTEFLRRAGVSAWGAEMASLGMMVLNCVATLLSMNFVDKCGRRHLLLGFGFLNIVALVMYSIFAELSSQMPWTKYGCITALFAFSFTYSVGLGPVPWYLTAELSPQMHRSFIQSIAISSSTVAGMTTGLLTLPLYGYMNATSFFPLFIVPSLLCLIYLYRQLPETKNKEIYEIVRELRGGSSDSDSCLGVNML